MKTYTRVLTGLTLCAALLSGCGGNNPVTVLGDANSVPTISLPMENSWGSGLTPQAVAFGNGSDQLVLYGSWGSYNALAPVDGVITSVENIASEGYLVSFYFNARFTVQVTRLSAASVRTGDYVKAGQLIGQAGSGLIGIRIYQGGVPVCPYTYFSQDSKNRMPFGGFLGGSGACVN